MSEMETSTVDAPRDSSSGQFTGSEEKFGIQSVEESQGFKSYAEPSAPAESDGTMEEAFDSYKKRRGDDDRGLPLKRELIHLDTGEKVADNLAVTVDQAAEAVTRSVDWERAGRELLGIEQLREQVDKSRSEAIKENPRNAAHYGLDEGKDAEATEAEKAISPEVQAMVDSGVSREVAEAISHPEVRASIEQEFARADHVRESYTQGLQAAHQFGQAALLEVVPELSQVPLDRWADGLNMLAQVDPARAQAAVNMLQRVGQIQAAQQQAAQQQQQVQRQQHEATRQEYSRASDAALGPMTYAEKASMVDELVSYVGEYGVTREQFAREAETNLALHHPAFQKMASDAVKYQRMQKAAKAVATRPVPSVQRPGVASSVGDRDASEITSLRQKAAKSGSTEDAFALYKARKARR